MPRTLERSWTSPPVGVRASLYDGNLDFKEVAVDTDVLAAETRTLTVTWDTDVEFDSLIGMSLGADFGSGPIAGRVELLFVDVEDVGFSMSVNYGF